MAKNRKFPDDHSLFRVDDRYQAPDGVVSVIRPRARRIGH